MSAPPAAAAAPSTAGAKKSARGPGSAGAAAASAAAAASLLARSLELVPARGGWTISVDARRGRSAVAVRTIEPGSTIIDERAAGWTLLHKAADNCAFCCRQVKTPHTHECCSQQQQQAPSAPQPPRYCSSECVAGGASLHRFTCALLSRHLEPISLAHRVNIDSLKLVVNLVGEWLKEQAAAKASAEAAPAPKSSATAASGQTQGRWSHVQDLVSHVAQADPTWLRDFTGGMSALHAAYQSLAQQADSPFAGLELPTVSTLVELGARINSNSHAICDNFAGTNSLVAYGLFPTTSILNHSCAPNSFFSATGRDGGMVVRTLRRVECGEELTVPYIDLYQPRFDRLNELYADKQFWCTCDRCQVEEKFKPSSVDIQNACKGIAPADPNVLQNLAWLDVGSVQCPTCLAREKERKAKEEAKRRQAEEKEKEKRIQEMFADDEAGGGKKKKKAKAKSAASAAAAAAASASSSAAGVAAATSSLAAASLSSPSAAVVVPPSLLPLSTLATIGRLVWRGTTAEIARAPLASDRDAPRRAVPSDTAKTWVCMRPGCSGKYTGVEVDAMAQPLMELFSVALQMKQARRYQESLKAYIQVLLKAKEIVSPSHVLIFTTLTQGAFSLANHLDQHEMAASLASELLKCMVAGYPENLPEQVDFLVAKAKLEKKLEATAGSVEVKRQRAQQAKDAYETAYRILLIACGPDHPRTINSDIPKEFRRPLTLG